MKSLAVMIFALAGRAGAFKRCCMREGCFDGVKRKDYSR